MSSDATFSAFKGFLVAAAAFADGVETRANKRKRERRDANAGEAIPGLLNDIVVTHVLRSEHFDDPADLARLPAVSRAMRDAVAATGLRFEELGEKSAVNLGCFSALQRLALAGRLSRREILCQVAARVGNLEKLKVLRAGGCPWDKRTCTDAAMGGHLEVLQWARAKGCPWDEETCACAAFSGHLELLQWARANGCPCGTSTCSKAAEGGHLDVLQWLHADGCPWDELTCAEAAWGGYLQVLQWARTNGCPWDDKTCQYSAQSGHLQVLQWARANGCPWNEWTCSQAASGGHLP